MAEPQRVHPKDPVGAEHHHATGSGMQHASLVHRILRLDDLTDHNGFAAAGDDLPSLGHEVGRPECLCLDRLFVTDFHAVDGGSPDQRTRLGENCGAAQPKRRDEGLALEDEFVEAVGAVLR